MISKSNRHVSGFTLIEVMLVIVIISIFAAMVRLSVGGMDARRTLQARENLKDNLALVRVASVDESRTLGIISIAQTATQASGYQVVTLPASSTADSVDNTTQTATALVNTGIDKKQVTWVKADDFKSQTLPEGVSLEITLLQQPLSSSSANKTTDTAITPKLIWSSNGEATPAKLQLIQHDTMGSSPVGDAIYITATGIVADNEYGDIHDEKGQ